VVDQAAFTVVPAIAKTHRRIVRLVLVCAPAVQQRFTVAVQVDEIADLRKTIEQPNDVACFRLRRGARTDVTFVIAGVVAAIHSFGCEVTIEAPQQRKVPVDVDTDALRPAAGWRRPAVLPPPRMPVHAEAPAVGIDLRK